LFINI